MDIFIEHDIPWNTQMGILSIRNYPHMALECLMDKIFSGNEFCKFSGYLPTQMEKEALVKIIIFISTQTIIHKNGPGQEKNEPIIDYIMRIQFYFWVSKEQNRTVIQKILEAMKFDKLLIDATHWEIPADKRTINQDNYRAYQIYHNIHGRDQRIKWLEKALFQEDPAEIPDNFVDSFLSSDVK